MKTLVNKDNPQIRITAPSLEIKLVPEGNVFKSHWEIGEEIFRAEDWTLVEEEQPEVDFKVKERKWVHDAVDSVFPEDGDFMSEFDFRKIIKDTARHFYELGRKGGRE